jgi:D-xylose transport system ATP-binding protein
MADPAPLLAMKGITKRFGAVEALVDVDFEVSAGEVVALVGDNGAGKSTLIKVLAGIQPADAGAIWFDGEQARIRTPADAHRLGIVTVYQDLALCDNLDVVANLFLVVILDEPTAALGVIQTKQVLELIARLKQRGLGVVVISHNLDNVFHVADRIVVLRLGRRVASFDRRSSTRADVVAATTSVAVSPERVAA